MTTHCQFSERSWQNIRIAIPPPSEALVTTITTTTSTTSLFSKRRNDVRGQLGPEWVQFFKDGRPQPQLLKKVDALREVMT